MARDIAFTVLQTIDKDGPLFHNGTNDHGPFLPPVFALHMWTRTRAFACTSLRRSSSSPSDNCPDLRELVLPHLDLNVNVSRLHIPKAGPHHGLKRLSFCRKDSDKKEDADEDGGFEGTPALDNEKVTKWARYIRNLFPKLDAESGHRECRSKSSTGWVEVFARVRDMDKGQNLSQPGGTVRKALPY